MDPVFIFALLMILGAIVCFLVDTVRTGFGLVSFGLCLLSIFFLLAFAIPMFGK